MKRPPLPLALAPLALAVVTLSGTAPRVAEGYPDRVLESAGALTFGPPGVLFVADSFAGQVVAFELAEKAAPVRELRLERLDRRIAERLGRSPSQIHVHDLAISPVSHAAYVTVSSGPSLEDVRIKNAPVGDRTPHLIRVSGDGEISEIELGRLPKTRAALEDVRESGMNRWGQDRRSWNVLEMKFVDETLFVSGVSNEEWSSKIRRIRYPFREAAASSSIRIFHTAHGRWETDAPARVFAPYERAGKKGLLAGFSCTPLVDISVADLESRRQVEGRTIAELGPGNHVLDMISVEHGGKTHFLLANHLHPFMSLALDDFEDARDLTRPTSRAGIDRRPLAPSGVTRLANLGDAHVVMLREGDGEGVDLITSAVADLLGDRTASTHTAASARL